MKFFGRGFDSRQVHHFNLELDERLTIHLFDPVFRSEGRSRSFIACVAHQLVHKIPLTKDNPNETLQLYSFRSSRVVQRLLSSGH